MKRSRNGSVFSSGQPTDQKAGGSNPSRRAIWQETRNPSDCGFFLYSRGFTAIFHITDMEHSFPSSERHIPTQTYVFAYGFAYENRPHGGPVFLFFTPPDSLSPHTCYSGIVVVHQDVNVVSSHPGIQCNICLIHDNHRCAGGDDAGVCCNAAVDPIISLTLIVLRIPQKFSNRS